ncbi:hypothetical protein DFH09DRAFT_941755 [Mycena vulgaris]|nr:hypothetical protein DFH09DRAFT_941755 [Mycena vulgaris]
MNPQTIQFSFNAQHDCRACGCDASGVTRQMQSARSPTQSFTPSFTRTTPDLLLNTHGFHNAGLLRKYLPIALTKPRPLFPERRERHDHLCEILAVKQKEKRTATKEKARLRGKRTRQRKLQGYTLRQCRG